MKLNINTILVIFKIISNRIRIYKLKIQGCSIGKNCSIGKISVLGYKKIKIGNNVVLEDNVRLKVSDNNKENNSKYKIIIQNDVFIGYGSVIDANQSVIIDSYCMLGPYVFVSDSNHIHHLNDELFKYLGGKYENVLIKKNCWIGTQSVILAGVTIEKNCIIAANSTVIKSVGENTLCSGIPSNIKRVNI